MEAAEIQDFSESELTSGSDSKGRYWSRHHDAPLIIDPTGCWIHQGTATPQAILFGKHWQYGRDTTMDGHAWWDDCV